MMLLRRIEASHVPPAPAITVSPHAPAQQLLELAERHAVSDYVVTDADGYYIGMVVGEDLRAALLQREAIPLMIVRDLMRTDLPAIQPEERLDSVLDKFSEPRRLKSRDGR